MEFDKKGLVKIYNYFRVNEMVEPVKVISYPLVEYGPICEGDKEYYNIDKLIQFGEDIVGVSEDEKQILLSPTNLAQLVLKISDQIYDEVISPTTSCADIENDLFVFYDSYLANI